MKITNDAIKQPPVGPAGQGAPNSARAAEKAPVAAPVTDNVRLSPQAQQIDRAVGANAVFDANKVERISKAIAEGRFQVNPEKVADGLLETVRDLLHTRKQRPSM